MTVTGPAGPYSRREGLTGPATTSWYGPRQSTRSDRGVPGVRGVGEDVYSVPRCLPIRDLRVDGGPVGTVSQCPSFPRRLRGDHPRGGYSHTRLGSNRPGFTGHRTESSRVHTGEVPGRYRYSRTTGREDPGGVSTRGPPTSQRPNHCLCRQSSFHTDLETCTAPRLEVPVRGHSKRCRTSTKDGPDGHLDRSGPQCWEQGEDGYTHPGDSGVNVDVVSPVVQDQGGSTASSRGDRSVLSSSLKPFVSRSPPTRVGTLDPVRILRGLGVTRQTCSTGGRGWFGTTVRERDVPDTLTDEVAGRHRTAPTGGLGRTYVPILPPVRHGVVLVRTVGALEGRRGDGPPGRRAAARPQRGPHPGRTQVVPHLRRPT